MAYTITLKGTVSVSSRPGYIASAYELYKASIDDRKILNWNVGSQKNPILISKAIENTQRNKNQLQTWMQGDWDTVINLPVTLTGNTYDATLGQILKDQLKTGPKFNKGNVAEGILAAAITARFIKKLGKITDSDVTDVLKEMKRTGGKITGNFLGPNENTSIPPDDVEILIGVPALDSKILTDIKVINGPAFNEIIPAAVMYANERHVTKIAEEIYRNGVTDHVLVDSDGIGNQKGTKVDLKVLINDQPTTLNISLKAGQVKQFGQMSGGTIEVINKIFDPLGVQMSGSAVNEFNKLLGEHDNPGAVLYAYKEIQDQLTRSLNSTDGSQFFRNLGKFVGFHATKNEQDVELVQLDRGEAHILQFTDMDKKLGGEVWKTHFSESSSKLLIGAKKPTTKLGIVSIASHSSKNPKTDYFVRIRSKVEMLGSGRLYFRNLIEKGPQMSDLLKA